VTKKLAWGTAFLAVITMLAPATLDAGPRQLKLLLAPNSTVPPAEILKHLGSHCPNVGITQDWKRSDFMLQAWGWSGSYHFTVFAHGGDAVYSTSTVMLGNAVKDVCKFVNAQGPQPEPAR
jgi:hypothetical protein